MIRGRRLIAREEMSRWEAGFLRGLWWLGFAGAVVACEWTIVMALSGPA